LPQLVGEVLKDTDGRLQSELAFRRKRAGQLNSKMGFRFYHDRWEPGVVRLVTSFATEQADVDDLLAVVRAVAAQ
jgi:threonine aldolase